MKKINMANPYFDKEQKDFIHSELDNILDGKLSMGPNVKKFEDEISERFKVKYAVAMNSCTSALEAGLLSQKICGKEVILPSQTFIGSVMAIHLNGGIPIFAEIDSHSHCLNLSSIEEKITKKTAGILLVEMSGIIPDNIYKIKELCKKNKIFLMEDSAHSIGAVSQGNFAGTIGDIGCFSFYPSKVITSGEGGMLVTNDNKIANFAKSYQNRGLDITKRKELYSMPGRNVRMPELSALLGLSQLKKLNSFIKKRRLLAEVYIKELGENSHINLIIPKKIESSSFWKFGINIKETEIRDRIVKYMSQHKIYVDIAYDPPIHLQPVIKKYYNTSEGFLPKTEEILKGHIFLPCHPQLAPKDIIFICKVFKEALNNY